MRTEEDSVAQHGGPHIPEENSMIARIPQAPRLRALSLFCAALLLGLLALPARGLTVGEILGSPGQFDRKEVVLTGRAEDVRPRSSHRGNEYTTFTLMDESGRINLFGWGKLAISAGDRVEVHGVFQRVKQVGRYTFYNEVDASSVRRVQ